MAYGSAANFSLETSSDDDSIFIMQTPSAEKVAENVHDEVQ